MSGSGINIPGGRMHKRIKLSAPVMLAVGVGGEKVLYESRILDVSERGARVAANINIAPGHTVEIMSREGSGRAVRSRVVRVHRGAPGQRTELGLEFLESVPPTMWT